MGASIYKCKCTIIYQTVFSSSLDLHYLGAYFHKFCTVPPKRFLRKFLNKPKIFVIL